MDLLMMGLMALAGALAPEVARWFGRTKSRSKVVEVARVLLGTGECRTPEEALKRATEQLELAARYRQLGELARRMPSAEEVLAEFAASEARGRARVASFGEGEAPLPLPLPPPPDEEG